MIWIIAAIVWVAMGFLGAAMRTYAAGVSGDATSLSADCAIALFGPAGFFIGLMSFASTRGVMAGRQ